ncbi:uncharacterized protein TRAVEDRAFT_48064 [Trametes versicolor FP-101664 SS1]|uniref:uncharacterized protein n=1 Tax=Trametes versicolor (strain FP-101664) TaxID=717944 RepID=UPI0004621AB1|nr:uncharacterized protein TRAVEDRAFT_48064 [Trametes versicolor FP-101664 SS1]EIW58921.1 hypothetical protein TRAVEDRAFT_48064 [Trametes versicolor FP-101664 SS1]
MLSGFLTTCRGQIKTKVRQSPNFVGPAALTTLFDLHQLVLSIGSAAVNNTSSNSQGSGVGDGQDRAQSNAQEVNEDSEFDYDASEFWNFVDNELAMLRNVIKEENETPQAQEVALTRVSDGGPSAYERKNMAPPSKPVKMAPPFPLQAVLENVRVWNL